MHSFRLFELLFAKSNTTIFLLESAVVSATVVSFFFLEYCCVVLWQAPEAASCPGKVINAT
jgi:hypothetical protein